jgi:hypothetical protein
MQFNEDKYFQVLFKENMTCIYGANIRHFNSFNNKMRLLYIWHIPASITTLLGETAAVSRYPFGLKAALSSLTNAENAALSESGPFLQST